MGSWMGLGSGHDAACGHPMGARLAAMRRDNVRFLLLWVAAWALVAVLVLPGCAGLSTTEQRVWSGAAIGGALGNPIGAGLGALIGYLVDLWHEQEAADSTPQ